MNESSFPLQWPKGKPRTPANQRQSKAPFSTSDWKEVGIGEAVTKRLFTKRVSIGTAIERLQDQLERLGADHAVLSSNLETRLNGLPKAGQKNPGDPGVACWFSLRGKRLVLASDRWTECSDNIAAISAHIKATRSIEKYGVGSLEEAFAGYRTIEDFSQGLPWRRVLGVRDDAKPTLADVEMIYRRRAKEIHPDSLNGAEGHLQMSQLNVAIEQARKELATGTVSAHQR